ncbi:hypothetical protein VTH82DRAFT_7039 [Thermothelomyces myriococcoides]
MLAKTVLGGLALASSAIAAPAPNPIEFVKRAPPAGVVIQKCSKPGVLALAYDDGPYQFTSRLVDILDAAGAKATFFWTGTLYGCIYNQADAVKKAFASGHQIASHTWTHPHWSGYSAAQIQQEMTRLEDAFVNLIGKKPAYVRPPYLETGGQVLSVLGQMGYKVITNDIDTGDWNNQSPQQSEQAFIQAGAGGNGHIPLMHETYDSTVNVLTPWIIDWAKQNNLQLVTIAECLDDPDGGYQPGNFEGNGQNFC